MHVGVCVNFEGEATIKNLHEDTCKNCYYTLQNWWCLQNCFCFWQTLGKITQNWSLYYCFYRKLQFLRWLLSLLLGQIQIHSKYDILQGVLHGKNIFCKSIDTLICQLHFATQQKNFYKSSITRKQTDNVLKLETFFFHHTSSPQKGVVGYGGGRRKV